MNALSPGSTIGILGGGQLGRMLAIAAARLGFQVHIYSDTSGPAFDVASRHTLRPFEDLESIAAWANTVDVVTYEFENVPVAAAAAVAAMRPVRPGVRALEVSQDRLIEKRFIEGLGLPVAPFAAVCSEADLRSSVEAVGVPSILKTRRLGYDGRGQARIGEAAEASAAFETIGKSPAILEGFVSFACEVSVILVRGEGQQSCCYDIPKNTHENGILATSTVPGPLPSEIAGRAIEYGGRIAEALDYIGTLAVEMFYVGPDCPQPLVINEFAPRVHNSGHWTLDACSVCQFENHIRAIAGWPLGTAARHSDAVMSNLLGTDINDWQKLAAESGACLHIYGKREARPGRKMGHVTRLTPLTS
jgi:5-(carboxyamino)imidazole ribonucleotide synthase